MFPGQCGNTAFFFKSQPDQFHFEFRGIVFPGKSFFSAHEVSTCKISGCLSYRILDSGPDGTQTTLTRKSWNLCLNVGTNVFRWVLNSAQRVAKTAGVTGFPCWLMNRGSNRHRVFFVSGATDRLFNSAFSRRNLRSCMTYSFRLSSKEADISILRVLEYFVGIPFSGPIRIRYRFLRWLVGAA